MLMIKALRHYLPGALLLATQAGLASAVFILSVSVITDSQTRLAVKAGEHPERVGIIHVADPRNSEGSAEGIREDVAALSTVPGVRSVAVSDAIPFGGRSRRFGMCSSGKAMDAAIAAGSIEVKGCAQLPLIKASDDWLPSLGLHPTQGNGLQRGDALQEARVVLLSQTLADALYGSGRAVGQQLYLGPDDARTVIGVFPAIAGPSPGGGETDTQWAVVPGYPTGNQRYFSLASGGGDFDRRTLDAAIAALHGVAAYRMIDPDKARSLQGYRDDFLRVDIFKTRLLSGMTLLVLVIMMVGVSGMVGSWVNRRRRAIGIRRALGARRHDVVMYFLLENLALCLPGALCGLLLAGTIRYASSYPALSNWSYGVAIIAAIVVVATNLLACLHPSLRAARQEPLELLRAR
ncbi:FtsX-like permease family protein [Stenotrophomonas cyclobalanopsidis]|uniref:FtsX-like permease family protein n=1 Tax=Stenotrophomonas cyclobalanopsidis TaxID=2771362 RepID=A0ABQ6T3Q9_9GAMM|nr:FtsX-like permease family protein [Stenotrophomonas cyclobalanopsidis]KAA9002201.1 FtsX-like permease family protein [Stenotrophomonas cyclobalanopsidis]